MTFKANFYYTVDKQNLKLIEEGKQPIKFMPEFYFQIRPTDANFIFIYELPWNIIAIIKDIVGYKPKLHIKQKAMRILIEKLGKESMHKKDICHSIICHWIRSVSNSCSGILDFNICDQILSYYDIVTFDLNTIELVLIRYKIE